MSTCTIAATHSWVVYATPLSLHGAIASAPAFLAGLTLILMTLALLRAWHALRTGRQEALSVEEGLRIVGQRAVGIDLLHGAAAVVAVSLLVIAGAFFLNSIPSSRNLAFRDALFFAFLMVAPGLLFYDLVQRVSSSKAVQLLVQSYSADVAKADHPGSLNRLLATYNYYKEEEKLPPGVRRPALFDIVRTQVIKQVTALDPQSVVPFSVRECGERTGRTALVVLLLALMMASDFGSRLVKVPPPLISFNTSSKNSPPPDQPRQENSATPGDASRAAPENQPEDYSESPAQANSADSDSSAQNLAASEQGSSGASDSTGAMNSQSGRSGATDSNPSLAGRNQGSTGGENSPEQTSSSERSERGQKIGGENKALTQNSEGASGSQQSSSPNQNESQQSAEAGGDESASPPSSGEGLLSRAMRKLRDLFASSESAPSAEGESGKGSSSQQNESSPSAANQPNAAPSNEGEQGQAGASSSSTAQAPTPGSGATGSSSNQGSSPQSGTPTMAQGNPTSGTSNSGNAGANGPGASGVAQNSGADSSPSSSGAANRANSGQGGEGQGINGAPAGKGESSSTYGTGTDPNLYGDATNPPTQAAPGGKQLELETGSSAGNRKDVIAGKMKTSNAADAARPEHYNKLEELRPEDVTVTASDPFLMQRIPKAYENTIKRLLTKHE